MSLNRLLLSQKNTLSNDIADYDFDPREFVWAARPSWLHGARPVEALTHVPTGSYFTFDFYTGEGGQHAAEYSPAEDQLTRQVYAGAGWNDLRSYFRKWLGNVRREYHAPDLWAELGRERELTVAASSSGDGEDNSPFKPEEQARVAVQLHEIKELLVRTEQLQEEQVRMLESRIDYLADASTRLGRRDWLSIFYGTVFSWALSALISPAGARELSSSPLMAWGTCLAEACQSCRGHSVVLRSYSGKSVTEGHCHDRLLRPTP